MRSRFEADNAERAKLSLHVMPIDEYLLAALPKMPECSGIALGIDRLLMIATNQMKLEKVITFPADISWSSELDSFNSFFDKEKLSY